jgi:uncharacterized protein (DUF58 family)
MNPALWVRGRLRRWWLQRLRPSDDHLLSQRNVYILPTASGLVLSATLLVLLLASINFQLNLGYALTFLLAGCTVVGMHMGHATLRGLHLRMLPPAAHFLDAPAALTVQLHNLSGQVRYGVGLALHDGDAVSWTEVPAKGSCSLSLAWRASHRGWVKLPLLRAETRFPMGALRVWTVWQPAACAWVYPQPEKLPPALPAASAHDTGAAENVYRPLAGGEWDGMRGYQRGDPPKLIVWKKAAQALATGSAALVSRDTGPSHPAELWLNYADTGLNDKEARLSRLCAWVLAAESRGMAYGLRIPGLSLAPASGAAHQQHCLQALALC